MTAHPGPEDLPYLRRTFVDLQTLTTAQGHDHDEVARAREQGQLPGAAYVLEDGTELVAPDYFELAHIAGSFADLPAWFAEAWDRVAVRYPPAGTADEQWEEYLTGIYAVCLRVVTPHNILAKARLTDAIGAMVERPEPRDPEWRRELITLVDGLDAIEKPFARFDRARFGPVSRDRLIDGVRARFGLATSVDPARSEEPGRAVPA